MVELKHVTAGFSLPYELLSEARSVASLPYESLKGVQSSYELPYESLGRALGGTAMLVAAAYIAVRPPSPEHGYHMEHRHEDLVMAGLLFGLGAAALYTAGRGLLEFTVARHRQRFNFTRHV